MKKLSLLIFLCVSILFGEPLEHGIPVTVRLQSGSTQKADFIGISKDTIFLGGYINEKFTTVKILSNRIASITDSTGNIIDPTKIDSLLRIQTDTINFRDTASKPSINISQKALFFAIERRPIDSALAARIGDLAMQAVREHGEQPLSISTKDFPECTESSCVFDAAKKGNAASLWTGEIKPGKHQDSLDLFIHRYAFDKSENTTERLSLSAKNATSELLSNDKFLHLLEKAEKRYTPTIEKKSYIFVETDPEGASLSKKGGNVICRTPCSFATEDSIRVELEAYWNVDNTLWASKAVIRPIFGDTAKISLRLKRVQPEIAIHTEPSGADIFNTKEIDKNSRAIGHSPKVFSTLEPGPADLLLWKPGYKDTLISFNVNAIGKTELDIKLTPISNAEDQKAQEKFIAIRKRVMWGHILIGTALAPAVAGGILLYLSDKDYSKAKDLKNELEMPSSANGENYQKLIDKNHHYSNRGSGEFYTGAGALLLAGGLLITGIIISF